MENIITINTDTDNLEFLCMGCWGVYCDSGNYMVFKSKNDKIKQESISRGQLLVARSLKNFVDNNPSVKDMFLAGDNVYQVAITDSKENNDLIKENKENLLEFLETRFGLKLKDKNSVFNIRKQISEGFDTCFRDINIERYFVAVGNHDIENCDILNTELKNETWDMPSTYYNVIYKLSNGININVIVIDTNMFEKEPLNCNGELYSDSDILKQIQWIDSISKMGNWNLVIGHIPYKANGHKDDKPKILNRKLKEVLNIARPQLYICADEHNQQFLYDDELKVGLVICGSGGTALDKNIENGFPENTLYKNANFGFTHFNIENDILNIQYINSETSSVNFRVSIGINGELLKY